MIESNGLSGTYPPMTNSCPLLIRYFSHAPLRLPGSYRESFRLASIPPNPTSLATRIRSTGVASIVSDKQSAIFTRRAQVFCASSSEHVNPVLQFDTHESFDSEARLGLRVVPLS